MNKIIIGKSVMHQYVKILCITFAMTLSATQTSCLSLGSFFGLKKTCSVGIIHINGDIDRNTENVMQKVLKFSQDKTLKGILLIINSGGGSAGASELIFREIKSLSKKIPIVTLVTNWCCSGAYEIATGSHWIVAPSSAAIGSIGAIITLEHHKNLRINTRDGMTADVDYELIKSGKYKALRHSLNGPLTKEERAILQAQNDAIYKIFCALVAQERKLSLDSTADWAEGKVFNGNEALEKKLIDEVGGFSDAINALGNLIFKAGTPITSMTLIE